MTNPVPCTRYNKNFMNALPFSNYNFNALLAEGDALAWTIPGVATQKFRVKFTRSSTAEIWVNYNGTATDPTSNTATTNAYQELVPLEECRQVFGGQTLSFLAPATNSRVSATLTLMEDNTAG